MTSGATKKCWSCENTTHYDVGWCIECRNAMPDPVYLCAIAAGMHGTSDMPPAYAGAIRGAIAQVLALERRPKPAYASRAKPKGKIDLGGLDV